MINEYIPSDILDLYEVHNYRHAAEVFYTGCNAEFFELIEALRNFRITTSDLLAGGGNESQIPKRISSLLRPKGWYETRIQGDLIVTVETHGNSIIKRTERRIEKFLDGHKIDYVKNTVAFDLEWNSKDQTFDRDLYAFRAFNESGVIDVAALLTRSESLNDVFRELRIMKKYGASTTWMGKLLYRLNAGRNGSCPVLVFGITPKLITDFNL
jgi:hypothetical protein